MTEQSEMLLLGEVTADEVKAAMIQANIEAVYVRECSLCGSGMYYRREGEQLFYDSNCDCVTFTTPLQARSWQSAADWINMNTGDVQLRIKKAFGL